MKNLWKISQDVSDMPIKIIDNSIKLINDDEFFCYTEASYFTILMHKSKFIFIFRLTILQLNKCQR